MAQFASPIRSLALLPTSGRMPEGGSCTIAPEASKTSYGTVPAAPILGGSGSSSNSGATSAGTPDWLDFTRQALVIVMFIVQLVAGAEFPLAVPSNKRINKSHKRGMQMLHFDEKHGLPRTLNLET